jgi:hypothetical protein
VLYAHRGLSSLLFAHERLGVIGYTQVAKEVWQVGGGRLTEPEDAAIYLICFGEQAALIDAGTGKGHGRLISNIERCGKSLPARPQHTNWTPHIWKKATAMLQQHPSLLSNREDYIRSLEFLLSMDIDILCEGHFGIFKGHKNIQSFIRSFL